MNVEGEWSRAETETFLRDALVPVRIGCHGAGGLWMVSLWYRYRDGTIECATSTDADLVAFLRSNAAVSFEISTNRPPYMGVRGNGTATVDTDGGKAVLGDLLARYLGGADSELARWLLREEREEATISILRAVAETDADSLVEVRCVANGRFECEMLDRARAEIVVPDQE